MRDCLNFRLTGNELQVFCGDSMYRYRESVITDVGSMLNGQIDNFP